MDDTFSFVAPILPRRRWDPFAFRVALVATLVVAATGVFGAFVIRHEHWADAQRAELQQQVAAQAEAQTQAQVAASMATGATGATGAPGGLAGIGGGGSAQDSLTGALALAQTVVARGASLTDAGPASLSSLDPSLLFVDGPSTTPVVVSVSVTDSAWAAAAMGEDGTCYWLRLDVQGWVSKGTGTPCTGGAALASAGTGW